MAELDRLVTRPLAAFLGSVADLAGDRPGRLTQVRTEAEELGTSAVSLDTPHDGSDKRPWSGACHP